MRLREADAYFAALAKEVTTPLVLVLTGGIAAGILADERTTDDIDFAILRYRRDILPQTEALLQRLAQQRGILVQYSTDIARGSSISYLDWQKHSHPYKRSGFVEIRVLDPYYWSIGKIARGTDRDLQDLSAVIRKQALDPAKLARLWAKALKKSPASTARFNVKKQMTAYLSSAGKAFGKAYDAEKVLALFERALQKKLSNVKGRAKEHFKLAVVR